MPILCELCSERPAKYVCQECGRRICQYCFDMYYELCKDCLKPVLKEMKQGRVEEFPDIGWMLKFMLIGFIIMFIGIFLVVIASLAAVSEISGTFFFFIGPFPIVFGYGPYAPHLVVLSIFLFTILLFFIYWLYKRKSIGKI